MPFIPLAGGKGYPAQTGFKAYRKTKDFGKFRLPIFNAKTIDKNFGILHRTTIKGLVNIKPVLFPANWI
jgi:hypothetical protein